MSQWLSGHHHLVIICFLISVAEEHLTGLRMEYQPHWSLCNSTAIPGSLLSVPENDHPSLPLDLICGLVSGSKPKDTAVIVLIRTLR
jgi:hypothetical protein